MNQFTTAMKFDIPIDEFKQCQHLVKVYKKGEVITNAGDLDQNLYLLRSGSVGIYREIDGEERLITIIGSINFVGEMEILTGGERISTVKVYSDEVLAYVFVNPNLEEMVKNPRWGMTLLRRLSTDLKFFSNRVVEMEMEANLLRKKLEARENADKVLMY